MKNSTVMNGTSAHLEDLKQEMRKRADKEAKAEYRRELAKTQRKVDKYLEAYKNFKELERELKKLRSEIEPFMLVNSLYEIKGRTVQGRIEIVPTSRVPMNARYTSYDAGLLDHLEPTLASKCRAVVVDKEVVELLVKDKEIPKDLADTFKVTTDSYNFSTKFA